MSRQQRATEGFTLVEVMVALVVTTIMVLVITNFMLTNLEQSSLQSLRANQLQQTENSLDLAANDIRLSANADANNRVPDVNSPGGANQYGWASNTSTLVLARAVQDTSGNIIFTDPKNYITEKNNLIYFVQNGTLYKRTLAAADSNNAATNTCPLAQVTSSCPADKKLLDNVTSFNVSYLDGQNNLVAPTSAHAIELHVTLSKHMYGQNITADYTTRMVFRNV